MRVFVVYFAILAAFVAGCSKQPVASSKQPLPIPASEMTLAQAKSYEARCFQYGSLSDPRVPYSVEDCQAVYRRADDLTWRQPPAPTKPVGQPLLH